MTTNGWTQPTFPCRCSVSWRAHCCRHNCAKNEINNNNNKRTMYCGLLVGNRCVHVGVSSPHPGARLNGGLSNSLQSLSRHAEMDALRWLRRRPGIRKAKLVVVRWTGEGALGNSRPCYHCTRRMLQHFPNVSKVTYFEDGRWITESVKDCEIGSKLSSGDITNQSLVCGSIN